MYLALRKFSISKFDFIHKLSMNNCSLYKRVTWLTEDWFIRGFSTVDSPFTVQISFNFHSCFLHATLHDHPYYKWQNCCWESFLPLLFSLEPLTLLAFKYYLLYFSICFTNSTSRIRGNIQQKVKVLKKSRALTLARAMDWKSEGCELLPAMGVEAKCRHFSCKV